MVYVRFNDSPAMHRAKISKESDSLIKITFLDSQAFASTSGFRFFLEPDGPAVGIYDEFRTVRKIRDDSLYLSSDSGAPVEPEEQTLGKRVQELEETSAESSEELTAVQLALCEVYEMVGGLIDG